MSSEINQLSSSIIQCAVKVHQELGPGLLESVYQACMVIEFQKRGIEAESEVPVPIYYAGEAVNEEGFRIDILVENLVIVELKSVEEVKPIHKKQLLTYLRLARKPLGLLINFNEILLKKGITRIANSQDSRE